MSDQDKRVQIKIGGDSTEAQAAVYQTEQSFERLEEASRETSQAVESLGQKVNKLSKDMDTATAAGNTVKGLDVITTASQKTGQNIESLVSTYKQLLQKIEESKSLGIAGQEFEKLTGEVKKTGHQIEDVSLKFKVLSGSADSLKDTDVSAQQIEMLGKKMNTTGKQADELSIQVKGLSSVLDQEIARIKSADNSLDNLGASAKATGDQVTKMGDKFQEASNDTENLGDSASSAKGNLMELGVAAGVAFAAIVKLAKEGIDALNNYNAAMIGLRSTADGLQIGFDEVKQRADELAADGLMPVTDIATAMKNLLKTGFDLDQTVAVIERLKDSAAFGRQEALSFGEAVRSATEGIKNGNSILVDNAGVTKNLSVMLKEAGYSAQDLMKAGDDAGVRMAIFNGIMRETELQVGDAAKLAGELAGTQSKVGVETDKLARSIGSALAPVLDSFLKLLLPIIQGVTNLLETFPVLTTTLITFAGVVTGSIALFASLKLGIIGVTTALQALQISFAPFLIGGAVIAGIAALVTAWGNHKKAQEEAKRETDELSRSASTLAKRYEELKNKENLSVDEKKELRDISEKLAKIFPDLVEGIDDETKALKFNTAELDNNAKARTVAAFRLELENNIKTLNAERKALRENREELEKKQEHYKKLRDPNSEFAAGLKRGGVDPNTFPTPESLNDDIAVLRMKEAELDEKLDAMWVEMNQFGLYSRDRITFEQLNERFNLLPQSNEDNGITTYDKRMAEYQDKKTRGEFASFEAEIKYLKVIRDGYAETAKDRKEVQDMLFRLSVDQYEYLAQKEGWSAEKKIAYLNEEVSVFAYSMELKKDVTDKIFDLEQRQKDKQYEKAVSTYEKEVSIGQKTAEQRIMLFKRVMQENGIEISKSEAAQKRLSQLEIDLNKEKQRNEEERAKFNLQVERERIKNITDARQREIEEENLELETRLAEAKKIGADTINLKKEHAERITAINRKYDEEERRIEDERMEIKYRNNEITYQMYRDYLGARIEFYEVDAKAFKDGEDYKTSLLKKEVDTRLQYEQEEKTASKQIRDYSIQTMAPGKEKEIAQAKARKDDALEKAKDDVSRAAVLESYKVEEANIIAKYNEKEMELEDKKWAHIYETEQISYEQYVKYLAMRLNDYEENSKEWLAIQTLLGKAEGEYLNNQQKNWKEAFTFRVAELNNAYEKEKKAYENKLPWQTKQLDASREAYKSYLQDCLNDTRTGRDEYQTISEEIKKLDEEQLAERQERWKQFFGEIEGVIKGFTANLNFNFSVKDESERQKQVDHIADQFGDNLSDLAAEGIGRLADTLLPGIGGIVGQIASTLFDLFSGDNWEEKLDIMMEGIGQGLHKFFELFERILRNLPKLIVLLIKELGIIAGNMFLEILESAVNSFINAWNKIFGWVYKIGEVDLGWDDKEAEKDSKKKDQANSEKAITYGDITGPLADRFDELISALSNLDKLQGLLDGIRNPIIEIRADIGSIKQMMGGFTGQNSNSSSGSSNFILQGDVKFLWEDVKNKTLEEFFDPFTQGALRGSGV